MFILKREYVAQLTGRMHDDDDLMFYIPFNIIF